MPAVFLSHSTSDGDLAKAVEDSLRAAFDVPKDGIRCAVTEQGAHARGADIGEHLRKDIVGCELFLLLLTPTAANLPWVLMETGAAWGMKKLVVPLFARGGSKDLLPEPIRLLAAADLSKAGFAEQLVDVVTESTRWGRTNNVVNLSKIEYAIRIKLSVSSGDSKLVFKCTRIEDEYSFDSICSVGANDFVEGLIISGMTSSISDDYFVELLEDKIEEVWPSVLGPSQPEEFIDQLLRSNLLMRPRRGALRIPDAVYWAACERLRGASQPRKATFLTLRRRAD
jgi:hypothetical protein